jgi:hypothetical protein
MMNPFNRRRGHGRTPPRCWRRWLRLQLFVFSTLGVCSGVCVVWGAPTFERRTMSPTCSLSLLLLRCFWFDWICASRGPADPSAGARPLKRQQHVSHREPVGVACRRVKAESCLTCAEASEDHDDPFHLP